MDALLMCGGRGTRLDTPVEKPRYEIAGRPMVDRVHGALADSRVETTYAVVSPHAPETAAHVSCPTIETPGEGYVVDLQAALDHDPISTPVLTVAADLPLLDATVVDRVLDAHDAGPLTVCVPAALKRALGVSADEASADGLVPAGINVVAEGTARRMRIADARVAVNVNHLSDARVAAALCHDCNGSEGDRDRRREWSSPFDGGRDVS
jgi:adenosylcobinamide-phosphate guanylyltransferase